MYGDKLLEFATKADGDVSVSRAVCLAQGDLDGDTTGIAPYDGLYLIVMAGEDIAAGLIVTLQHCDTQGGAFTTLRAYPATGAAKSAGDLILKDALPHGAKNWLKLTFTKIVSSAPAANPVTVDAVLSHNPDKWLYGVAGVD